MNEFILDAALLLWPPRSSSLRSVCV